MNKKIEPIMPIIYPEKNGIFTTDLNSQEIKIQQLEKENTALKQENYVMSGLLNNKEKKIVEKLQKLQDIQNECDTCIRQDCEIVRLKKENKDLKETKAKLTANRFIFRTKVRNEYLDKIGDLELQRDGQSITIGELEKENAKLKDIIEKNIHTDINIKLDKERLEKFLFSTENVDNENLIGEALIDEKKLEALSNFSIISKLSEQVITEDRIVEVLNIHMNFIDEKTSKYEETNQNLFKRIAHEILEGQGWEVVVSGEVRVERFNNIQKTLANVKIGNIYFRDIEEKLADECQGKNIEVAVREVK